MTTFRVLLRGQNFLLDIDGAPQKVGFYTTRFVEAGDTDAAELAAVERLRGDPKLAAIKNSPQDPPLVFADEIEPVAGSESEPGFAFFRESDKDGRGAT